ncbi:Hypothetical Protein FCC1311_073662 [Hondaea fermentalgiana]|uniref:Uncharacterized protein n=1 Tax=Hondaea fermentalgiana TaxID=2315210 RepID=A0A2R5GKJ3_9STRA|nr:Hypothetical Protein FCC1311_073662 [Hondaea fermentalgiana]|eukprot:GBG31145.1 Hypothetical Protein FCC1311_073662 [Hondaea fermentalgiana]
MGCTSSKALRAREERRAEGGAGKGEAHEVEAHRDDEGDAAAARAKRGGAGAEKAPPETPESPGTAQERGPAESVDPAEESSSGEESCDVEELARTGAEAAEQEEKAAAEKEPEKGLVEVETLGESHPGNEAQAVNEGQAGSESQVGGESQAGGEGEAKTKKNHGLQVDTGKPDRGTDPSVSASKDHVEDAQEEEEEKEKDQNLDQTAKTPKTGDKIVRVLQAGEAEVAEALRKGDDKIARWLIPPTPTSVASDHFRSTRALGDNDDTWSVSSRKTAPIVVNSSTIGLDAFADWLLPGAQTSRSARTSRSNTSVSARRMSQQRRADRSRSERLQSKQRRTNHTEEPVLTADFVLDDFKSIFASLRKLGNVDLGNAQHAFKLPGSTGMTNADATPSRKSSSSDVSGSSSNGRLKRGRVPSLADEDFHMRFSTDDEEAPKSASSYSFRDMVSS